MKLKLDDENVSPEIIDKILLHLLQSDEIDTVLDGFEYILSHNEANEDEKISAIFLFGKTIQAIDSNTPISLIINKINKKDTNEEDKEKFH